MEIRPVVAELFYVNGGSGGPTDRMKLLEILRTHPKKSVPIRTSLVSTRSGLQHRTLIYSMGSETRRKKVSVFQQFLHHVSAKV